MNAILHKTLGGLSKEYYLLQLLFGSIFTGIMVFLMFQTEGFDVGYIIFLLLSTLLYPYSRFLYKSIVELIFGSDTFFNSIFFLVFKIFTMLMCWNLAIFMGPIGLIYLYWHHSRDQ